MADLREVTTARLVLSAPTASDLDEVHELHADPAVWEHYPSLRHTDVAQTASLLEAFQRGWAEHGLGAWVVRARAGGPCARLLGVGGCTLRAGVAWNLGYRLHRDAWGHGYAQELITAARAAAAQTGLDLPVVAYLLEHNTGSRRAAERAGLELVWRGPDAGNPDPAAVRLVYADRALRAATLDVLTSRS